MSRVSKIGHSTSPSEDGRDHTGVRARGEKGACGTKKLRRQNNGYQRSPWKMESLRSGTSTSR